MSADELCDHSPELHNKEPKECRPSDDLFYERIKFVDDGVDALDELADLLVGHGTGYPFSEPVSGESCLANSLAKLTLPDISLAVLDALSSRAFIRAGIFDTALIR